MLFETPTLASAEERVVETLDELWDDLRYQLAQPRRWHGSLRRNLFARNVQASNSIEGHNVSVEDAAALLRGDDAPEASEEDAAAVRSYGDAMTYVISSPDDPGFEYSEALVKSLHFMMMKHDLQAMPGRFRPGAVFVWSQATQDVVYEGPDADEVSKLVIELANRLNDGSGHASHWIEASMAHLNLVMIHPFKDGNGRMARALHTLVLARAKLQSPVFLSIEEYLGRNTPAYYEVLGDVGGGSWNPENDARPWLRFTLTAHYRQAVTLQRRIEEADALWSAIDEERSNRGLHERAMGVLYNAAYGYQVRRRDHMRYADTSERVATSDLGKMVDASLLEAHGERRGRWYGASPVLLEVRERTRKSREPVADPFD